MVKTIKTTKGKMPKVKKTTISDSSLSILRRLPKRVMISSDIFRGANKTNETKQSIRKCVVRIKRCKFETNSNGSKVAHITSNPRPLPDNCNVIKETHRAQALGAVAPTKDICDVTSFEPTRNSTMCHNTVAPITPLRVRLKCINPSSYPSKQTSPPRVSSTPYSHSSADVRPPTFNQISPHKLFKTPGKVLLRRTQKIQPSVKVALEGKITPVRVRLKRIDQRTVEQTSSSKVSSTPNPDSLNQFDERPTQDHKIQSTVKDAPAAAPSHVTQNTAIPPSAHPRENDTKPSSTVASNRQRFFHRNQLPSRRPSSITRNVYEFLSESQIDDGAAADRQDPAADIIKQMLKEGRACAMIRSKTGKQRVKTTGRKKKVRPVGKRKQCSLENVSKVPVELPPPTDQRALSPIYEPEVDNNNESEPENQAVQPEVPNQIHRQPHRTLPEGAYSPLARSLLLNQTKTNHPPQESVERRRELLDLAKKFISTPINRKTQNSSALTPKIVHGTATEGAASPWRVPDEVPLPSTFVFGLNTSQLPSYSSDFPRRSHVYVPDEPIQVADDSCQPLNAPPVESSFNDSNGENVPPAIPVVPVSGQDQENENDENIVQLPNPRLTLQHRTPFKDINILDVVVLPSWKKNQQLPQTPTKNKRIDRENVQTDNSIVATNTTPTKDKSTVRDHVHFGESVLNVIRTPTKDKGILREPIRIEESVDNVQETLNKEKSIAKNHVRFEDSNDQLNRTLTKDKSTARDDIPFENSMGVANRTSDNKSLSGEDSIDHSKGKPNNDQSGQAKSRVRFQDSMKNVTTQQKSSCNLFGFEDFISEDEEDATNERDNRQNVTLNERLQRLKELRPRENELPQVSMVSMRHDYDDLLANEPRQRSIREMLCSTMIGSPMAGRATPIEESLSLFKDQDPETTFDEKKPRRTYVRERPKRKRKQRVHVLFVETDSSGSEDNEQDSHDKSNESPRKVKRARRDVEHEAKLKQFITSFNHECEEVEKFPLVIE